jgi:FlaA1/EpsC-like NDP-sugar epimerase
MAVVQIAIQIWDYYFHPITLFSPLTNALVYFFSFYIGIIASHYQQGISDFVKKHSLVTLLLLFLSGAYLTVQAYWRYYATHDYLAFYSQHRTSILIFTLLLGAFFYNYFNSRRPLQKFIQLLSKLSFFVFFFHIMIVELTLKYLSPNPQPLLFFLGISTVSFAIAYLVHRLPYLSRLTG